MKLAVIPARGGSKRIPQKNIKPFAGKPIIAYSIDVAIRSKLFDRVIVSTDDPKIAEIAKQYGAEVPFVRPEAISDDHSGTREVSEHAKQWFEQQGHKLDYICCIYATAPFLCVQDLLDSFRRLDSTEQKNYCFSVTEFRYPPQRGFTIDAGFPQMVFPECKKVRSQDLPQMYHDAGQFYWTKLKYKNKLQPMIDSPEAIVYPIHHFRVQDIDTEDDWIHAEAMLLALRASKSLEIA